MYKHTYVVNSNLNNWEAVIILYRKYFGTYMSTMLLLRKKKQTLFEILLKNSKVTISKPLNES